MFTCYPFAKSFRKATLKIICKPAAFEGILILFCKQAFYKQVAHGWKIASQLSEFGPSSLSNDKNKRLKKDGSFIFVINL